MAQPNVPSPSAFEAATVARVRLRSSRWIAGLSLLALAMSFVLPVVPSKPSEGMGWDLAHLSFKLMLEMRGLGLTNGRASIHIFIVCIAWTANVGALIAGIGCLAGWLNRRTQLLAVACGSLAVGLIAVVRTMPGDWPLAPVVWCAALLGTVIAVLFMPHVRGRWAPQYAEPHLR